MNSPAQNNHPDVALDLLLREYGAALARERREQRARGRGALSPQLRALVIAAHSVRPRHAV
jgi:hypothetical protein